jgi:hypothetical protein
VTWSDLCGTWLSQPSPAGCGPGQLCAGQTQTTFINQVFYQFFSNQTLTTNTAFATGGCPVDLTSGNIEQQILAVKTMNFNGAADDPNPGSSWTKVTYPVPSEYRITLLKNNKAMYYTSSSPGPCLLPVTYWNDASLGCPCNGTWALGVTRTLPGNLTKCGICPGRFFFSDFELYGNIRIRTVSGVVTVEITKTAPNTTGWTYGVPEILYTFNRVAPCSGFAIFPSLVLLVVAFMNVFI